MLQRLIDQAALLLTDNSFITLDKYNYGIARVLLYELLNLELSLLLNSYHFGLV